MKALLVFVLLNNTPTGQTEVMRLGPMPEAQCLAMEKAVWKIDWPNVVYENGVKAIDPDTGAEEEIPVTDAACLPLDQ